MAIKRNLNNHVIAGVCSGIADGLGVDPLLIRLAFVFFGIFVTFGLGALLYLILWILM